MLLVILLIISLLTRVWFYNLYYSDISNKEMLLSFYWGFRSDFTILFFLNLPVWLYLLFQDHDDNKSKILRRIIFYFFLLLNTLIFLINFIDLFYYRFTLRRSTVNLLFLLGDSAEALPSYLQEYWYGVAIFAVIIILFYLFSRQVFLRSSQLPSIKMRKYRISTAVFILIAGFALAYGLNKKPLQPVTLFLYMPSHLQPLANNSGFSMLYSILKPQSVLSEKHYFSNDELDKIFPITRAYKHIDSFNSKNVVLFILESFSKELLDPSSVHKARMPFLDSIMAMSTVSDNSFANGFESNKGIVAIMGSFPPFMEEPYFNSVYASNRMNGIGSILTAKGYQTSFFMGANYDHFGFAKWCKILGIQKYYSEKDYNNSKYHDGKWGISDYYFLKYTAGVLKNEKKPFFTTVFNLSSHIPFVIPDSLKSQFSYRGQNAQQNAVSYVDFSLNTFFNEIKKESWFNNTIFVFCADHAFFYQRSNQPLSSYLKIPIFFYVPWRKPVQISKAVQQMDVIPTILDLLNYSQSFTSFGRSFFDTSSSYTYCNVLNDYFISNDSYILSFSPAKNKVNALFNYKRDSSFKTNLLNNPAFTPQKNNLELNIKAFTQRYHNTLLRDSFVKSK